MINEIIRYVISSQPAHSSQLFACKHQSWKPDGKIKTGPQIKFGVSGTMQEFE